MTKEKAISIIGKLSELLNTNIKWLVGGSGSLLVHGIDIIPNDIDLIIDNDDYDKAVKLLNQYTTGTSVTYGNTAKTPYKIDDVKGDLLMYPINIKDLEYRNLKKFSIPVYKLELEYKFYKKREDKKEANQLKLSLIKEELEDRGIFSRNDC